MPALAKQDEPLVLADGTRINPSDGTVMRDAPTYVEIPTHRDAQQIVAATRRKLGDLPDVPARINPLSCVLMYTVLGLSEQDIAIALGTTTVQVGRIKTLDAYTQLYNDLINSLVDNEIADVRAYIASHAKHSAKRIVEFAKQTNDSVLAFGAAKDILDRSGNRAADIVEHRHKLEGGLTVIHVRKTETKDDDIIDITPQGEF